MLCFALFDNLGGGELFIAGIVALLVFGKRLPEVAAQAGQALTKFRRGLDSAWSDTGMDHEIRKIRDAMPKDMSMTDVARLASKKMEQRLREMEKGELPSARSSESVDPGAIADAAAGAALSPTPASTPAESSASTSSTPGSAAPASTSHTGSAFTDSPSSSAPQSYKALPAPVPPSETVPPAKGVDPAKNFGPPGSVPRE
jgi:Sec-independent protein translocase protein TatA